MENNKVNSIAIINGNGFRQLAIKTFGDDRLVSQATAVLMKNPALKECDITTFIGAVVQVKTLGLSLDQSIGQAYLIPYSKSVQLQIGWKGFITIAMRDKNVKLVHTSEVKEGEYKGTDFLTGEVNFEWNNTDKRESLKTIGYVAHIALFDGRTKTMYWSVEKMEAHAKKFSKSADGGAWKNSKDEMCKKTIVKMLLTKCGLIDVNCGIEVAKKVDQGVITGINEETGEATGINYIDNPQNDKKATFWEESGRILDEQNKKKFEEQHKTENKREEYKQAIKDARATGFGIYCSPDNEDFDRIEVLEEVAEEEKKAHNSSIVEQALKDIK